MQMCVIHRIRHRHKKNLSTARKMKQWQKDCRSVQQVIWSSQHRSSSSSLRLFWVSFFLELFSKCLVWSFLVFLRFKMLTFWSFENFFKYFKTKLYFQNKFTRFSVFFPNFMCLLNFHRKIVLFCFFLLRKINLFHLFSLFFIYFAQISTWFIPFSAQKWYLPMISQDFSRKNTQNHVLCKLSHCQPSQRQRNHFHLQFPSSFLLKSIWPAKKMNYKNVIAVQTLNFQQLSRARCMRRRLDKKNLSSLLSLRFKINDLPDIPHLLLVYWSEKRQCFEPLDESSMNSILPIFGRKMIAIATPVHSQK